MKNLFEQFSESEIKALKITTMFETGKPLDFGGLAGNFDGKGLSFGLLQWNMGSKTLQPLLKEFIGLFPARFAEIFGGDSVAFKNLLINKSAKEQLDFAGSINDQRNHISEPWNTYFLKLGGDPDMRQIQIKYAKERMNVALRYVSGLGFKTERALALMFDLVTQNGENWIKRKKRKSRIAVEIFEQEKTGGLPLDEKQKMKIIAEVVAATVKPEFSKDVFQRKMLIVNGQGLRGKKKYDLGRDFGLSDQEIVLLPF
jgi:hypothetical protein